MTPDELRSAYLNFFKERGHHVVPSAALVPENDPTTLFVGSGMQPLLPYLLGQPHPKGTRIVNSQKAFRSQDIEEAGDNRHTTFFEMLGNWSLGDYFKKEQLSWIYEFFTQVCGLDSQQLYVSVFEGKPELNIPRDEEAAGIWQELGIAQDHIYYYGDKKNWWSRVGEPANMPVGEPGGPDSEVFYDFGKELGLHEKSAWKNEECHPNCDCGRFLEIGNNVFMTYVRTETGFEELQNKNIDFGGGLERIAAAINHDPDVFKTQLFKPIIMEIALACGRTVDFENYLLKDENYYPHKDLSFESVKEQREWREKAKKASRIIADHIKAATFLASDGVFPSGKAQGYFSRRLIRRAIRYADSIGIEVFFTSRLVDVVAEIYVDSYPEIYHNRQKIKNAFEEEEIKFRKTLHLGNKKIESMLSRWAGDVRKPETKKNFITPEEIFDLYQTYGFPFELSLEILKEKNIDFGNEENIKFEFERLREEHADQSRTASAGMFKGGLQDHSETTVKYHTATHLLQAALRKVLGTHVAQSGSNITVERLRFDFTHPQPVTPEELKQVEDLMNEWIAQDLPVTRTVLPKQQALDSGAIAFFVEKYPDEVSVYTIGHDPDTDWISKEFCGGPHVTHTGEIGPIELFKEQSVAAGIRRIYARLR